MCITLAFSVKPQISKPKFKFDSRHVDVGELLHSLVEMLIATYSYLILSAVCILFENMIKVTREIFEKTDFCDLFT